MENLRQEARDLRKNYNHPNAIQLYQKIWNSDKPEHNDKWLGWEYADSLKRVGQLDESISICEQIHKINPFFKYINDLYAWCLYEKYFKNMPLEPSQEEEEHLFQKAELITNLVAHHSASPYEYVVFQILRLLKDKTKFPADRILYWLEKLNSELLSDDPYKYTDKSGRPQELQSRKEAFYSYKTKALYEKGLYGECAKCCDEALSCIQHFHHNNDNWISVRKAKSMGFIDQPEAAVETLIDLQTKNDHWSLLMDISLFYYKSGDLPKSLIYAYRAALTKDPKYMKINVYNHIAQLLEKQNDLPNALSHYILIKTIREEKTWTVPTSLNFHIGNIRKQLPEDILLLDTYNQFRDFWVKQIKSLLGSENGEIINIIANGKIGFIKYKGKTIFYKSTSFVRNSNARIGDKVDFCIIDSYDRKKDSKTTEAAYIELIK